MVALIGTRAVGSFVALASPDGRGDVKRMQWVEPKVFKIAETSLNRESLEAFLLELGAKDWMEKQTWYRGEPKADFDPSAALIEVAGRSCYKSFGVGLNPNITRIREDPKEYLSNVLKKGDGSITEHASVSWAFVDVSRVFCYSEDMDVLTNEGWKPWPAVTGAELFASLTLDGTLVYEPAEEHFVRDYEGPMYHVGSEQVDLLVTPNHRMWVQRVDRRAYRRGEEPFSVHLASEIQHKRVRYQKGGVRWKTDCPPWIRLPPTSRTYLRRDSRTGRPSTRDYDGAAFRSRLFSRFLGLYLAEGCLGKTDTSIALTQNPGPILDDMKWTVQEMGLRAMEVSSGVGPCRRLSFKNVALYDWLIKECGTGAYNKRVPSIVQWWPPTLLIEFLDALIKGDGNVHRTNRHEVLYTSSRRMADDVQVLALKAGVAANIRVDNRMNSHTISTGVTITKRAPNYIVSFLDESRLCPHVNLHLGSSWPNRFRGHDGYDDGMVPYRGKVYCVKVQHGLLYVRRNGKPCWSGNTHELVRHRAGVAISQESLRYVRPRELRMTLVPGSELARMSNLDEVTRALEATQAAYEKFAGETISADMGFDDKKAWTSALRRILPDGIATTIVWSANHRTLRWVLEMRTAPGAEAEMRYVFDTVGEILQRDHPLLYHDFVKKPHADGVGHQWIPQIRSKV